MFYPPSSVKTLQPLIFAALTAARGAKVLAACVVYDLDSQRIVATTTQVDEHIAPDSTCSWITRAIEDACRELDTHVLESCVVASTVQPDVMGLAALLWARVRALSVSISADKASTCCNLDGFWGSTSFDGTHGDDLEKGKKGDENNSIARMKPGDPIDHANMQYRLQLYSRFLHENQLVRSSGQQFTAEQFYEVRNVGLEIESCKSVFVDWQKANGIIY